MQPRVNILILNWNGFTDTQQCVLSLLRIAYDNFTITIVDNNSKTNDTELLKKQFYYKNIFVLPLKENTGFAEGNNIAYKQSIKQFGKAEYYLCLNNDTLVEKDFLSAMVHKAKQSKKIGIVGSKIFYYSPKEKIYCLAGGGCNILTDNYALIENGRKLSFDFNEEVVEKKIGYISGCCMLIASECIDSIGFFDKRFFTYFEETDFCQRAKKNGWVFAYTKSSTIFHKTAQSTKYLSKTYVYYMTRNRILLIKKMYPLSWIFISIFPLLKNFFGYTLLSVFAGRTENILFIFRGIYDALRNKFGKINL